MNTDERKLLKLVMIVKNEADTIQKTIETVRPAIDSVFIMDTGSTDGTQDKIREICSKLNVPLVLDEDVFTDFADTRTRAQNKAIQDGYPTDFIFWLNGDDYVYDAEGIRNFVYKHRNDQAYAIMVTIRYGSRVHFYHTRIIRSIAVPNMPFIGATHEVHNDQYGYKTRYLSIPAESYVDHVVPANDSRDVERWKRDVILLHGDLEKNIQLHRSTYYLAQSYHCLGENEKAFVFYQKRALMGGWWEEIYMSYYKSACILLDLYHSGKTLFGSPICKENIELAFNEANSYFASRTSQTRLEPVLRICEIDPENHLKIMNLLEPWLTVKTPAEELGYPIALGHSHYDYDYLLHLKVAISAWYVDRKEIGERSMKILMEKYPDDFMVKYNSKFYFGQ